MTECLKELNTTLNCMAIKFAARSFATIVTASKPGFAKLVTQKLQFSDRATQDYPSVEKGRDLFPKKRQQKKANSFNICKASTTRVNSTGKPRSSLQRIKYFVESD